MREFVSAAQWGFMYQLRQRYIRRTASSRNIFTVSERKLIQVLAQRRQLSSADRA